jgi:hypothetical protein
LAIVKAAPLPLRHVPSLSVCRRATRRQFISPVSESGARLPRSHPLRRSHLHDLPNPPHLNLHRAEKHNSNFKKKLRHAAPRPAPPAATTSPDPGKKKKKGYHAQRRAGQPAWPYPRPSSSTTSSSPWLSARPPVPRRCPLSHGPAFESRRGRPRRFHTRLSMVSLFFFFFFFFFTDNTL